MPLSMSPVFKAEDHLNQLCRNVPVMPAQKGEAGRLEVQSHLPNKAFYVHLSLKNKLINKSKIGLVATIRKLILK